MNKSTLRRISRFFLNNISKNLLIPSLNFVKNKKAFRFIHHLNEKLGLILYSLKRVIIGSKQRRFFIMGRDYVNWAIDRFNVEAGYFLLKNNEKLTKNIYFCTHIYCTWYATLLENYFWLKFLKETLKFKVIANITNDIRHYKTKLNKLESLVDIWIAPSTRIQEFLRKKGFNVTLIPFYIRQKDFFYINKSKEALCQDLDIDSKKISNKLIIGSFQRDSIKTLTAPKWQKNPDLLIKILKEIPKDKSVLLLSSPRRHYIINQCEKYQIPYIYYGDDKYINELKDDILANNQPISMINKLYNLSDLNIVTSTIEGGPLAILEASITKTLIFSTDVGFARDFLHKDLIFAEDRKDYLLELMRKFQNYKLKIDEYLLYNYNRVKEVYKKANYLKYYQKLLEIIK